MQLRFALFAFVLGCTVACVPSASPSPIASVDTRAPSAVISRNFARFVFPRLPDSPWVKPTPTERYPGESTFYGWSIDWSVRRYGEDPQQIFVVKRWKTLQPPDGPLSEIVREADVLVGTLCVPCEPTALDISRDSVFRAPALAAYMLDRAVIVTVTGRAAVSKLFRRRPDTVWFSITAPGGPSGDVPVAVRRK